MARRIFVTAATGSLCKPLALELAKKGWGVRTTTRDPSSPAAQELAKAGVEVFKGSWDDEDVLRTAMTGCDGVFMNLMPDFADWGADVRFGKKILGVAKSLGSIKHVIFSSSVGPNKIEELLGPQQKQQEQQQKQNDYNNNNNKPSSIVAHFLNNKRIVEEATKEAGFETWTIFRPVGFMSSWLAPKISMSGFPGLAQTGTWTTPLDPRDSPIALVDETDAALFAIAAFERPADFHARDVVVCSAVMHSAEEVIRTLRKVSGRDLKVDYLSHEEALRRVSEDNDWFMEAQIATKGMGKLVDMDEVKKCGVGPLHSFEEFLEREKESVERTYGHLPKLDVTGTGQD